MEIFDDEVQQLAAPEPENKILVVDDREDNLFSIESILEKDNYIIEGTRFHAHIDGCADA